MKKLTNRNPLIVDFILKTQLIISIFPYSQFQAKEMFEEEASLLQNRLEGLMYAWKNCPIQLYRVELSVYWIVAKKVCFKHFTRLTFNFRSSTPSTLNTWAGEFSVQKFK